MLLVNHVHVSRQIAFIKGENTFGLQHFLIKLTTVQGKHKARVVLVVVLEYRAMPEHEELVLVFEHGVSNEPVQSPEHHVAITVSPMLVIL